MSKVIAIMSMSLDGHVADVNDGVDEVFDWYFNSGDVEFEAGGADRMTFDVAIGQEPKLDVFTYDVGAELRAPAMAMGKSATFRPCAGAGAGGRSCNHRKLELDATHNVAAYGSVGGELGVRRVRVRLEARDYVTGFKPLAGSGESRVGNDVVVMVGVGFVRR